jgi:hypothetical protein
MLSKRFTGDLSTMQLMMLNALSAGFLIALTSASVAQELQLQFLRTRFCIGSGNCPIIVQVMRNCGSDADQIAELWAKVGDGMKG